MSGKSMGLNLEIGQSLYMRVIYILLFMFFAL